MKQTMRKLALLMALLLCGTTLSGSSLADGLAGTASGQLSDVESHWAREEIRQVLSMGLMDPATEELFAPEEPVTRAVLVTALYRLAGSPSVAVPPQIGAKGTFDDVLVTSAAYASVEWAAAQGIVTGYNGEFRPDDSLTREELATIFWRFCRWEGYDNASGRHLSDYTDGSSVADWAQAAMDWALEQGLLTGMGNNSLSPKGTATRAQLAAILLRYTQTEQDFRPAPDAEITDPVPERVTS